MRGDRPWTMNLPSGLTKFPPHARGSTFAWGSLLRGGVVSPACAGIDPGQHENRQRDIRFPRMRGDRPSAGAPQEPTREFPPHARGSTRFVKSRRTGIYVSPACAGIDRRTRHCRGQGSSFPRMRGDRPGPCAPAPPSCEFPPHARGSTSRAARYLHAQYVSPACAGIDPPSKPVFRTDRRFPRMRGDRPESHSLSLPGQRFPPHARGST